MKVNVQSPQKKDREPRHWKLTTLLKWTTSLAALLILIQSFAVSYLTTLMAKENKSLRLALSQLRNTQAAEINILKFSRLATQQALTKSLELRQKLEQEQQSIQSDLSEIQSRGGSDHQISLHQEATQRVSEYLTTRQNAATLPLNEAMRNSAPSLERALLSLETLVESYRQQANQAMERSQFLDHLSDQIALFILIGALALIAALYLFSERYIYSPLLQIHSALDQFSRGIKTSRAPTQQRVAELNLISQEFNHLADQEVDFEQRRTRFLAGTAHDLKNPLTAMKMAVQLLRLRWDQIKEDQKLKQLDLVERQVIRLEAMVTGFMDAVRIEAGDFTLCYAETDLNQAVQDITELWKNTSSKHQFVTRIPQQKSIINCDPVRMEQVITNLISNAIKYSPSGGLVEVEIISHPAQVQLIVRDSGIGIAKEDMPKIFEPFHRSSAIQQIYPGFGLGLWVTKKLVEAHQGKIRVESEIGKGSQFIIEIPRRALTQPLPQPGQPAA